jgi:hypothetical protein
LMFTFCFLISSVTDGDGVHPETVTKPVEGEKMIAECTISRHVAIERANIAAYTQLCHWHYRGERLGPYTAIFGARPAGSARWVGVIVYSMPPINSRLRAAAMAAPSGSSVHACPLPSPGVRLKERIRWLNTNVRCISRVVVDPRYRGVGLAARLVRETLPLAGVPIVEALAAMGQVNPFFEKAGMTRYDAPPSEHSSRLENVFERLGIPQCLLIDPREVTIRLENLPGRLRLLAEAEIRLFMKPYVKFRNMPHSIERTRFVLSRLCTRPVYYLWRAK